jgi:hypothetical protein
MKNDYYLKYRLKTLKIYYFFKVFVLISLFILFSFIFDKTSLAEENIEKSLYYVSITGSDSNNGKSLNNSFKTIQKALNIAGPGSTINISPGEYKEDLVSSQNGKEGGPITIIGTKDVILRGGGNDRMVEINHDYHVLDGFTIDGLHGSKDKKSGYRDILIYVLGKNEKQGVKGAKITNMTLKNAGGECVRLRYFITDSEISYNTITNCGIYDFIFDDGGKNGEGVYIGTSSKQWGDGKNPTDDPDETKNNIIHHNYIDTQGNECVDIKEGSTENIIEYNTCRGQKDSDSGGFDSRGDNNIFRYNDVRESLGAGIRLGGWKVEGVQYGKNNDVYENTIIDNKNGGVKFQISPQGKVCGNTTEGNKNGASVGSFRSEFDPNLICQKNIELNKEINLKIENKNNNEIKFLIRYIIFGPSTYEVRQLREVLIKEIHKAILKVF